MYKYGPVSASKENSHEAKSRVLLLHTSMQVSDSAYHLFGSCVAFDQDGKFSGYNCCLLFRCDKCKEVINSVNINRQLKS